MMKKRKIIFISIALLLISAGIYWIFGFFSGFGPVASPVFFPDDAELNQLWTDYLKADKKRIDSTTRDNEFSFQFNFGEAEVREAQEAGQKLIDAFLARRLEELRRINGNSKPVAASFDAEELPSVDGSTSCETLALILKARATGHDYQWFNDEPSEYLYHSPASPELSATFSDYEYEYQHDFYNNDMFRFRVRLIDGEPQKLSGTHKAYRDLIISEDPDNMIIFVARTPSKDEQKLATEHNVELETVPIARDAFVFIANRRNPVDSLTLVQIRDLFSYNFAEIYSLHIVEKERRRAMKAGELRGYLSHYYGTKLHWYQPDRFSDSHYMNWKSVGGPNRFISIYERPVNSGSRELMDQLVMKENRIIGEVISPYEGGLYSNPAATMYGLIDTIRADAWSIGYSLYWYEHFMVSSPVIKVLAVDGVPPNYENIRTEKYPIISPVYAAFRKGISPESRAAKYRDWILSADGQRTVKESGYVPIDPEIAAPIQ